MFMITVYPISVTGDIDITGQPHQVEIILRHFRKIMRTSDVLEALDAEGLRSATMLELFFFAIKYPELQRQFPIIAFDPVDLNMGDYSNVGCLCGLERGWSVEMSLVNRSNWYARCRFPAVRK